MSPTANALPSLSMRPSAMRSPCASLSWRIRGAGQVARAQAMPNEKQEQGNRDMPMRGIPVARDVDAWMARLSGPQRGALEILRAQIRAAAPGAEEKIYYGQP